MATEESSDAPTRDGATAPERTAAELGSMVADQVRAAIESAEQSAEELRRRALDDAAADRGHIHRSAAVVLTRIDAIEAQITRLLNGVRDEVVRIREQVDSAQDAPQPVVDPPSESERPESRPDGSTPDADPPVSPERAAPRRHARRFGRRRRALPQCAVCGRAAEDGEEALERWRQVRRTSLCPECQVEGWQVPEGASVPYRSPQGREPG
jgi:hypothetical protein